MHFGEEVLHGFLWIPLSSCDTFLFYYYLVFSDMLLKILLVTQDLTVLRHCGTHLTGLDVALQYSSPQSLRRPLPLIQAHPSPLFSRCNHFLFIFLISVSSKLSFPSPEILCHPACKAFRTSCSCCAMVATGSFPEFSFILDPWSRHSPLLLRNYLWQSARNSLSPRLKGRTDSLSILKALFSLNIVLDHTTCKPCFWCPLLEPLWNSWRREWVVFSFSLFDVWIHIRVWYTLSLRKYSWITYDPAQRGDLLLQALAKLFSWCSSLLSASGPMDR